MNRTWKLKPGVGIESDALKLSLGMTRQEARGMIGALLKLSAAAGFDDEDDFEDADHLLRLRYHRDKLQDIEFLKGTLVYEGITIAGKTSWPVVEKKLAALGHESRETEWLGDGYDFPKLGINIASHEVVGGDGDGIEWVIMSSEFKD